MKKAAYLFVFFIGFNTLAQERVDILLDSLTLAKTDIEKSKISLKVAEELKFTDWKRALYYLEFSEEQIIKSNSKKELGWFYKKAGDVYYDKDALDIALEHYLKAYDILGEENQEDKNIIAHGLAVVYGRLKKNREALMYFRMAHKYTVNKKDTLNIAKSFNNIGTVYFHENQLDSAFYHYNASLDLIKNIANDDGLKPVLYTNIGRCYAAENNEEMAHKNFRKAILKMEAYPERPQMGWVYNTVAHYFFNNNQADSAIFYATKAKEILNTKVYSFENQDAVNMLYQSHLLQGNYKEAADYYLLNDRIRDSLNMLERAINIEKIEIEQEYKAKERIRQLEKRSETFKYYIIVLCLFITLLILVILLVRYRNKWIKSRLKSELFEAKQNEMDAKLELKNKELIGKAMLEIHRTEIIQEILDDLKQIKRRAVKQETQQAIDYILKRLQKDIHGNIWNEFEVAFEQVHESFYTKLQQEHPDLTSRDKRLCAMLKLNLTSKEIGQLTGQSFKSVENARTRLRKKLNLTNIKVDLTAYLSEL